MQVSSHFCKLKNGFVKRNQKINGKVKFKSKHLFKRKNHSMKKLPKLTDHNNCSVGTLPSST